METRKQDAQTCQHGGLIGPLSQHKAAQSIRNKKSKSQSTSSSHPPLPTTQPEQARTNATRKRIRKSPVAPAPVATSHDKAVDNFVRTIIDPSRHASPYPGCVFEQTTSRQVISIDSQTYGVDEGGKFLNAIYVVPQATLPIYATTGVAYDPGVGLDAFSATQDMALISNADIDFIAPLFFDDDHALWCDKVNFSDGNPSRPGYRTTVTVAAMQMTVFHPAGLIGSLKFWTRNGAGAYVPSTIVLSPVVVSTTLTVPIGSTAFGFALYSSVPASARITVGRQLGGAHRLVVSNHPSLTLGHRLPDSNRMEIKRIRLIGLTTRVTFTGNVLDNAGLIIAAQLQPGTFPVEFGGNDITEQIRASQALVLHEGRFSQGANLPYVQSSADAYDLGKSPVPIANQGIGVIAWWSNNADPQSYRILTHVAVSFTSKMTAFPKTRPPYALYEKVSMAIALLQRMERATENPSHEQVLALWDKLRHDIPHWLAKGNEVITIAEHLGRDLSHAAAVVGKAGAAVAALV